MTHTLGHLRALAALTLLAAPLAAQVPSIPRDPLPESAQLAGVMRAGLAMLQPARLVLAHRAELGLTDRQVRELELLAATQSESLSVRQGRAMQAFTEARRHDTTSVYSRVSAWTGEIDEARLRAEACARATAGAESMIGLARDRRAAGALLTPEQLRKIPAVERREMMESMRRDDESDLMPKAVPVTPSGKPRAYFEFQVEKQATLIAGTATPMFPPALRGQRQSGVVLAQFVVDTTGTPDVSSFKVIKSDDALFTGAVRAALPSMRFAPAEVGGVRVRQLVQMPFEFRQP